LYRFPNVRVRLGIAAKDRAEQRHEAFQIAEAEPTPECVGRLAEVEREQTAARPGHTPHLAQPWFEAPQVSQPVGDGDNIETVVGKRKAHGVAAQKTRDAETGTRSGRVVRERRF